LLRRRAAEIGMTRPSDIDQNMETFRGDLTFREEDRVLLAEFSSVGKAPHFPAKHNNRPSVSAR
jgi:hypothetical protein